MAAMTRPILLPTSFFFYHPATSEIYTLSLHDALPIFEPGRLERLELGRRGWKVAARQGRAGALEQIQKRCHRRRDRKSTRLNSSHLGSSYAVFCLKKKRKAKRALARDYCELCVGTTMD